MEIFDPIGAFGRKGLKLYSEEVFTSFLTNSILDFDKTQRDGMRQ